MTRNEHVKAFQRAFPGVDHTSGNGAILFRGFVAGVTAMEMRFDCLKKGVRVGRPEPVPRDDLIEGMRL